MGPGENIPSKDSRALLYAALAAFVQCLGGTALFTAAMHRYNVLDLRRLLPLMAVLTLAFAVLWVRIIFLNTGTGKPRLLTFRIFITSVSAAAGSMIACMGLILWLNGYGDRTVRVRALAWEAKRAGRGDDPAYYAVIRAPANPKRTLNLNIGRENYLTLAGEKLIRLSTASGRLRIEWIRNIELADKPDNGVTGGKNGDRHTGN
jgi:hypothetical protein